MKPLRNEKARELSAIVRSEWLDEQLQRLGHLAAGRAAFATAYSAAGRRVGEAHAGTARTALLLETLDGAPPDEGVLLVEETFSTGDNDEREALLSALTLLPDPSRFVALAVEACRTNVRSVFVAISCGNSYPAEHFPEAAFNQMVLKALFLGVPVARIAGLDRRTNPELVRMVEAYRSERIAAGRDVPEDIARLLGDTGAPGDEGERP